jgi:hypothetical protein
MEHWLNKNGMMLHLLPLAWHPFSIINRILGNKISKFLIPYLRPGTENVTGYPAYYHLCNSVSLNLLSKNSNFKYKIKYFFGAEDYFSFFLPLSLFVFIFNRFCFILNLNIFASNAVIIAYKKN